MAYLGSQFEQALELIEPSERDKANAPKAHQEVRDVLRSAPALSDWGLNPILIGSYKRGVSIRRVKDVDVFCRMEEIGNKISAIEVLDRFYDVLDESFGEDELGNPRVVRQGRSIKVEFPEFDGIHVDAVPARPRSDGYWEIPKQDGGWQLTNPDELTTLKTEMNENFGGNYVPLVKLMRQTRLTLLGKGSHPGGLFVEMCLYNACLQGKVDQNNLTLGYVSALQAVADYIHTKVQSGAELPDPTLPGHQLYFRATESEWDTAQIEFGEAAHIAHEAFLEKDAGKAAMQFRGLLGVNGDGEVVFPMPAGYSEDGSEESSSKIIRPGSANVPAGDRRFG